MNSFLKTLKNKRLNNNEEYESSKLKFVKCLKPKIKLFLEEKILDISIDKPFYINFTKEDFISNSFSLYKFNPRNIRFLILKELCEDEDSILSSLIWKEFDNKYFSVRFFVKKEENLVSEIQKNFYKQLTEKNIKELSDEIYEPLKTKYSNEIYKKLDDLYVRWNFKKTPNLWFILRIPTSELSTAGTNYKNIVSKIFYQICAKNSDLECLKWKILKSSDDEFININFILYETEKSSKSAVDEKCGLDEKCEDKDSKSGDDDEKSWDDDEKSGDDDEKSEDI